MHDSIYIFDFDGTLTRRDSLPDFLQFAFGRWRYLIGLVRLSPVLAAYKAGFISNNLAKEKLLAHFFQGWEKADFEAVATSYSAGPLQEIIREEALAFIRGIRTSSAHMVVVSASVEEWLRPWCTRYGIDVIGTRMEVEEGRLTGRFAGRNCHGPEKVRRIREVIDLSAYGDVHVFGDSRGDLEMLKLADHRYYRYFN